MSIKMTKTTADYLPWEEMMNLVQSLYRDKEYRLSLLIISGCHFGLRISDLRSLRWVDILSKDKLVFKDTETGHEKRIPINYVCKNHIRGCWEGLQTPPIEQFCFLSRKNTVISTQRINTCLKEIKKKYNLSIQNFTTHSFRKTMGMRIVLNAGYNAEIALNMLSILFEQRSSTQTRKYLGLQPLKIKEIYELL